MLVTEAAAPLWTLQQHDVQVALLDSAAPPAFRAAPAPMISCSLLFLLIESYCNPITSRVHYIMQRLP